MASLKNRAVRRKDASNNPSTGGGGGSSSVGNKSSTEADHTTNSQKIYTRSPGAIVTWLYYLAFLSFLAAYAYMTHYALPKSVIENRDPVTGELQFSEANVRALTGYLSEDIGLRIIGTRSLDETERYLIKEIEELRDRAKSEIAKGSVGLPKFDMWVQVNDGSHRFDFMSKVVMKMYTNMTNIIVRLSCGPECDMNAILLNAHYDTTLGSPGAADDALGVGIQLELILFNGGEESLQDASHSFITQHELKPTVRAVINLEGCGTKGPEILFQANSRQMIDAYKKVPYPHGNVIANELFSTGMILSDTDFRQFVDYGNLTGLDMAVYMNSYLYHTHLDLNEHMDLGLPQHMGENALALVKHLGNEASLTTELGGMFEKTSEVVFFDILGVFFVAYSLKSAEIAHTVIFALALISLSIGASKPTIKSVVSVLISAIGAIVAPNFIALFLVAIGKPMQWFTSEWLPLVIFGPSSVVGMFIVQYLFHDNTVSDPQNEFVTLSGVQFFFSVLMGTMTYAGIASSYIFAVYAFPYTLGMFYNKNKINLLRRLEQINIESMVTFSAYIFSTTFPTTYFWYVGISLFDFIIPLTGRTGVNAPVDHIAAAVTGVFVFASCPPILALAHRHGLSVLRSIISFLLILQAVTLAYTITFLQPYDKMHPKRIFAQHLRNITSGETLVYVAHADPSPIYQKYIHDLETLFDTKAKFKGGSENPGDWNAIYPFNQFLDSYVLDTTPYIRSETLNETIATSTSPLTDLIHDAPKLYAEEISYDTTTGLRRLTILCTHPGYIWTVISFNSQLTDWSLSSDVPSKDTFHYVVRHAGGYLSDGWRLDLEYKASGPEDKLVIELTSMESESFDWRVEMERELSGSGDIGVMRKLVKATPDLFALTYIGTVTDTFRL
ncbi:hypothetical protein BGZ76_006188 [Entomortierella beljakovae]|nr:hypothetical protein BGZ76_006188 [Entomortierella beljakovae]